MSIESPAVRKSESPEGKERVKPRKADKGALMAAALFLSLYPADLQTQVYPIQMPLRSVVRQPQTVEYPIPEKKRYWDRERIAGPRFKSFIEGLIEHARSNSRTGGTETARVYVVHGKGQEQILDAEEIASSDQVHIDYNALWEAISTNGAVLLCHTHPFDDPTPEAEGRRYVYAPSSADLEVFLRDVAWVTPGTFAGRHMAAEYRRNFSDVARRLEECVVPAANGFWKMRVENPDTAIAWLKAHQDDSSYQESMSNLLKPFEKDSMLKGANRQYVAAFRNKDADQLAVLIEKDMLTGKLQGEAKEEAERFMTAYNEYRSTSDYSTADPDYARLNEVAASMFDTLDMAGTKEEYAIFQEEVLRLYGIKVEWISLNEEEEMKKEAEIEEMEQLALESIHEIDHDLPPASPPPNTWRIGPPE